MNAGEFQARIQSELDLRKSFKPVRFNVSPSTGSRRLVVMVPAGEKPQTREFLRSCEELLEHGGYLRIDGEDGSSLFLYIDNKQIVELKRPEAT